MKKHFRAIATLLCSVACSLGLAVGLTACGDSGGGKGGEKPNPDPAPGPSHVHEYETDWASDGTHHWHEPKCNDTTEKKDKAAHLDENDDGVCDVCEYELRHTFATELSVDEYGHWYAALCGHADAEEYEFHDFTNGGKCDCGVEEDESEIYNDYYKPYCAYAGETVLDFNDWHRSLVDDHVTHVEINADGDVVYTRNGAETETVYFAARTVQVTLTRHSSMSNDYAFPTVKYTVVAVVDGDEKEVLVTDLRTDAEGALSFTFTPYAGLTSADVTYKLKGMAQGNFLLLNREQAITVAGKDAAIAFASEVVLALGVGESGKSENIPLPEAYDTRGRDYYINAPEGWYWLSYTGASAGANTLGAKIGNGDWFEIYSNTSSKFEWKGLIYSDGGITLTMMRMAYVPEGGDLLLEKADLTFAADGETYYLPSSFTGAAVTNSAIPLELDGWASGSYLITAKSAAGTGSPKTGLASVRLNGVAYTPVDGKVIVTLDASESNALVLQGGGSSRDSAWNYVMAVTAAPVDAIALNTEKTISFEAGNDGAVYYQFTAPADGYYTIKLNAATGNVLTNVRVGQGVASTGYITAEKDSTSASYTLHLNEGEIIAFNVNVYNGGTTKFYPTVTVKVVAKTNAELEVDGSAANVTFDAENSDGAYYNFTAEEDGLYTIILEALEGTLAGVRVGNNTNASDVISSASGRFAYYTFDLHAGDTVTFNLNYTGSAYPTVSVKVELTAVTKIDELDDETTVEFTNGSHFYSFTAEEAGEYAIYLTGSDLTNVRVGEGASYTSLGSVANGATYFSVIKTLEAEQTVVFNVNYTGGTAPQVSLVVKKINYAAVTLGESKEITFDADNAGGVYYTFTAGDAGVYTITFTATEGSLTDLRLGKGANATGYSFDSNDGSKATISLNLNATQEITFNVNYNAYTSYPTLTFKVTTKAITTLTKDVPHSVTVDEGSVDGTYFTFKVPTAGYYSIVLEAQEGSVLTDVRLGNGISMEIIEVVLENDDKLAYTLMKSYGANASISFNVFYVGSADSYPSLTVKVTDGIAKKLTLGTAESVTFRSTEKSFFRQFTATEAGVYLFESVSYAATTNNATNNANGLRYTRVGTGTSTTAADVIALGSAARYSATGVIYLTAGQTVIFSINTSNTSSTYYGTYTFKLTKAEATAIEEDTATTINLTAAKPYSVVSLTASETESYLLNIQKKSGATSNHLKGLSVVQVLNGTKSTAVARMTSASQTATANISLTEGQTVTLVFVFEGPAALTTTSNIPVFTATLSAGTPIKLDTSYKATIKNGTANIKLDSSVSAGVYMLSSTNVQYSTLTIAVDGGTTYTVGDSSAKTGFEQKIEIPSGCKKISIQGITNDVMTLLLAVPALELDKNFEASFNNDDHNPAVSIKLGKTITLPGSYLLSIESATTFQYITITISGKEYVIGNKEDASSSISHGSVQIAIPYGTTSIALASSADLKGKDVTVRIEKATFALEKEFDVAFNNSANFPTVTLDLGSNPASAYTVTVNSITSFKYIIVQANGSEVMIGSDDMLNAPSIYSGSAIINIPSGCKSITLSTSSLLKNKIVTVKLEAYSGSLPAVGQEITNGQPLALDLTSSGSDYQADVNVSGLETGSYALKLTGSWFGGYALVIKFNSGGQKEVTGGVYSYQTSYTGTITLPAGCTSLHITFVHYGEGDAGVPASLTITLTKQ